MYLKFKHMRVKCERYLCPVIYYYNGATAYEFNVEHFQYPTNKTTSTLTYTVLAVVDSTVYHHPTHGNKMPPFSKYNFRQTAIFALK